VTISYICKTLAHRVIAAAAVPKSRRPGRRSGRDLDARIAHMTFSPTWLSGRGPVPVCVVPRKRVGDSDRPSHQYQNCSSAPRMPTEIAFFVPL
jgi:hypothetical protein